MSEHHCAIEGCCAPATRGYGAPLQAPSQWFCHRHDPKRSDITYAEAEKAIAPDKLHALAAAAAALDFRFNYSKALAKTAAHDFEMELRKRSGDIAKMTAAVALDALPEHEAELLIYCEMGGMPGCPTCGDKACSGVRVDGWGVWGGEILPFEGLKQRLIKAEQSK
jgi:hypothetical protein